MTVEAKRETAYIPVVCLAFERKALHNPAAGLHPDDLSAKPCEFGWPKGVEVVLSATLFEPKELEILIASLAKDHDDLGARLRTLSHAAKSQDEKVRLHGHYFAFRGVKPTVSEFVNLLSTKLISFCLSRKKIAAAQKSWEGLSDNKKMEGVVALRDQAVDLFKRAHKNTNRNGEFGEVITYLLIESVLKAPQMVAKMSLKTNRQMPVHGSDGIHFRFDAATGSLTLLWGESKCYSSVTAAMAEAVKSVAENLQDDKMAHEVFLIGEHADLSVFPDSAKEAILSFLNPYDENYNKRVDGSVILIAFDFAKFAELNDLQVAEIEPAFEKALCAELDTCAARLDVHLKKHAIKGHALDVFFLPVPSVDDLRTRFQDKIGWSA